MLVVLAIIGGLTALAIPLYSKMSPRLRMLSATQELMLDLRRAHSDAVTHKTITTINFPSQNSYVVGGKKHNLAVEVKAVSHAGPVGDNAVFHFYPDGSADPWSIMLFDSGRMSNIRIDGLTGRLASDEN